jgi:IS5 family transposase
VVKKTTFITIAHTRKLRCERFLDEMQKAVPWKKFFEIMKPFYFKDSNDVGRPKKDLILMLKIYFLQQWYNLSDPEVEDQIHDRYSFQKFLEIDILSEVVPDETTTCKFRHFLERNDLQKKMFSIMNSIFEKKGMIVRTGTTVDATIISAPGSTKNMEGKRDKEMTSTKKGSNFFFGMKMHIGVDTESSIVHTVRGTTASVHDSEEFESLLHGEEKALFGDKAYANNEFKRESRKLHIFWGILDKAMKGHKLSSKQRRRNKKLSMIRCKVEHPFQVIKVIWRHTKTRYKGLNKNIKQWTTLFMLANIFRKRKELIRLNGII